VGNVRRKQDPVPTAELDALVAYFEHRPTFEHDDPLVVALVVVDGRGELSAQDVLDDGATEPSDLLAPLTNPGSTGRRRKSAPNKRDHASSSLVGGAKRRMLHPRGLDRHPEAGDTRRRRSGNVPFGAARRSVEASESPLN
jgi:hypothetical protein